MSASQRRRPAPFRGRWTAEEDALLGVESDEALARKFGRTVVAVKVRRHEKRITDVRGWSPEEEKLLGTRPDCEVAKLVGRGTQDVGWKRRKLGIPCCYSYPPWTPEHLELVGKKPDKEVALLTGHSLNSARHKRWVLRRPSPKPERIRWTPEQDRLLGKLPDSALARWMGRTTGAVRERRRGFRIKLECPASQPGLSRQAKWRAADRRHARMVARRLARLHLRPQSKSKRPNH